jgi:DNA polymerase III sliding clamp (beta) subunit (PCNA family)
VARAEQVVAGLQSALKVSREAPVVVESRSNRLFIGSYNEFHSIVYECPTDWGDHKYVLPFAVAKELPKLISDSLLLEQVEDNRLKVVSNGTKLKLALLDPASLTLAKLVSKYSKEEHWVVDGKDLQNSIERVKHAANDKNIGDEVLKGYHLTKIDEYLEVMASNGSTLSVSALPLLSPSLKGGRILLNKEFNTVAQLLFGRTVLAGSTDSVSITSVEDDVTLRVVSLLTKGQGFDQYRDIVSGVENNPLEFTLPSRLLSESLKRNEFFTDEKSMYRVSLYFSPSFCTISSQNAYGESKTQVPVIDCNTTDDIEIDVNGLTFQGFLNSSKTDTVTIKLKDDSSPMFLTNGLIKEVSVVLAK